MIWGISLNLWKKQEMLPLEVEQLWGEGQDQGGGGWITMRLCQNHCSQRLWMLEGIFKTIYVASRESQRQIFIFQKRNVPELVICRLFRFIIATGETHVWIIITIK